LIELGRRRHLVMVASSDLSHYHDHDAAATLDGRFRDLLVAGDPGRLWSSLVARETEACGAGPVLTLMEVARQIEAEFTVVDQCDSSRAFGDTDRVVGYLSALAIRKGSEREERTQA
jgi:AmmeMemoRadiSam system protein B